MGIMDLVVVPVVLMVIIEVIIRDIMAGFLDGRVLFGV
jgi:hypothetical protein